MIDRIEIVSLAVSVLLLVVVLELVRRRRLTEEYSFLWILTAVALLLLSAKREILQTVARWLGVSYPPAVLLLLMVTVFVASLWFSVILSRQRRQIERLIEETAILSAELRELRAGSVRSPLAGDHLGRRAGDRLGGPESQRERGKSDSIHKPDRIN